MALYLIGSTINVIIIILKIVETIETVSIAEKKNEEYWFEMYNEIKKLLPSHYNNLKKRQIPKL